MRGSIAGLSFPYRRFAAALAGVRARLRVDAVRYSLIVLDFHRLVLAGLSGALRKIPDVSKSKIRSRVEHVFAEQKDRMGLFIITIGIARATTKIGMANLVYNIKRLIFPRNLAIA